MIIYIYGEDTFRSRDFLSQNVERFKKERDPQGMNVVFLDGQKVESSQLWNEITATPFLAEKKMIVVQNILSTKDTDVLESLVEGIKKIPEKNIVVFYQSESMGKSKLVQELQKLLAKEKWAKEFINLVGAQLSGWIKTEAEQRGGSINPAAIAYLTQNVGKDIWYADSLIDQLIAYAEGKEISLADVQLFLEEKVDDNIFNMVDAIVVGNRKLAFKLIEEQRRLGEEDGLIFGMALRQFRILISMRDLFNRQENITSDTMAKMLDLHPFVVKKSLPFIKKYSLDKLKDIYNQLLEIDIKTKTGLADQSLLIDLFVGKLA
ncbi:MAG: DNA polymerase III, delta subunit [Parcubacteria group bacterium Gr01-1014_13]|nr:MAG: DNA polymerase III, delta subunit [Parcubacteria group bacterium Gr01-1014_13]